MAAKKKSEESADRPDFSEPWLFSDVVFVVEDKKFHVHRYVLAQWSPVFETMFSSEFKSHELFDQIEPQNFKQIAEGIILRHEKATARCNYCSRTVTIRR